MKKAKIKVMISKGIAVLLMVMILTGEAQIPFGNTNYNPMVVTVHAAAKKPKNSNWQKMGVYKGYMDTYKKYKNRMLDVFGTGMDKLFPGPFNLSDVIGFINDYKDKKIKNVYMVRTVYFKYKYKLVKGKYVKQGGPKYKMVIKYYKKKSSKTPLKTVIIDPAYGYEPIFK